MVHGKPIGRRVESSHSYGTMAAGLTGDGRVAVVAQPSSAPGVLYIDQNLKTPNQQWNAPVNLGKPASVTAFNFLATATDAAGRVEVFGTDTAHKIWWKYQNPNRIVKKSVTITPPGTKTPITVSVDEVEPPATPWSDWLQMPGELSQLKALRNADGRIILFGINPQNHLYRNEQRVAKALQPSDWTGWVQMDNTVSGTIFPRSMAPVLDAAGAVNLFVIGMGNHQILHARQAPACRPRGRVGPRPASSRREFKRSPPASMAATIWFLSPPTSRTSITRQGNSTSRRSNGAAGRLHTLLGLPPPNFAGLWCVSQMAFDSTEWELGWTELAPEGIHQYAVVRDLTTPTA